MSNIAWFNENRQLLNEFSKIDRSLRTNDGVEGIIKNVWKDSRDNDYCRIDEFKTNKKQIVSLRRNLTNLQNKLQFNVTERTQQDIDDIQHILESFEDNLQAYKSEHISMMAFTNQEVDSLLSELEEFDHEMEGWISTDEANAQFNKDNSTAKMKKQQKLKSEQRYNMDMEHYRKMGKLDSMLVTLGGGRNGFWDARDHDGFLRIWTQYVLTNRRLITDVVVIEKIQEQALGSIEPDGEGGTLVADGETGPDFVSMEVPPPGDNITNTNLHPSGSISVSYDDTRWILPHQIHKTLLKRIPLVVLGKDVDEINAHIKWYLQHTMLHLEKKKLLSQWKRNKLIGGGARATDDVDSYLQTQSSQISGKIGEPRSATPSGLSRRGSSGGASGSGSVTSNTEDERELTRLRVKMWREEKALAAAQRKADEEAQKRLLEQKKFEQKRRYEQKNACALKTFQMEAALEKEQLELAKRLANDRKQRNQQEINVVLAERRAKDLSVAKKKLETKQRVASANDASKRREQTFDKWKEKQSEEFKKMEGDTLLQPTKTFELNKITPSQRLIQEERRSKMGAHARVVAGGARDLQYGGRAVPSWTSGARHHMT